MKVAIVHDYIKEYGGAERVLESLHDIFPKAPIFTTVYLPSYLGPHEKRFDNWDIRTSWAQNLPLKAKLISPLRLLAPMLFKSFDFSDFDVIIVSATGAYSPNILNKKDAVLVCYCHTPPRFLYGYETARNWKKNPVTRAIGATASHFLRMVDYTSSQNVDYFIANSEETKKRIEKFYRQKATVIYPPVNVGLKQAVEKGNYYLAGGRMARAKHPDLIIKAFLENGLPLKVFGKTFGGYESEIRDLLKQKGSQIEYLGEVSDEEKERLMAGAKAFIFASKDEDFGIVPVEAMMLRTPVIAHRSGGVLETVKEGETGLFFDEFSVESLNSAIRKFEKMTFDQSKLIKHAQKYSRERFEKEIKEFVDKAFN
jgi:glycosyltransferase involved in cell wall biosynthesis